MNATKFPRWIFAVISIGCVLTAGIYLGIMSVEGITGARVFQASGFGLLGLLMFWGVYKSQ